MRLRRYRPVALTLLVLHLGPCATWRPTTNSPQQMILEERSMGREHEVLRTSHGPS